jgi:Bacterial Ig domain
MFKCRVAVLAVLAVSVLVAVPNALATAGGQAAGKPGRGSCTRKPPYVKVDNTWAWGQPGSFGLPGQQLTYAIDVMNYDLGCGSSSFVVNMSAPSGFSVSMPTNTISLKSASSGYLWATVTSPSFAADGDYPLTVTAQRAGSPPEASYATYYKVYSSDSIAPTLYWPSPADGATISGRSYNIAVSSYDDHAVNRIELFIDGVYQTTAMCDNVSYSCQLTFPWPTSKGQHSATFTSYDWKGNAAVLMTTFAVS